MDPAGRVSHGSGLDARHLEDVLEQSRQTLDLGQHEVGLLIALDVRQPRRVQIVGRDPDRRQRCAEIVRQRRQQRRLELGAALGELRLPPLLEEMDALDGNGDDAAERVERAGLDRPASDGEDANRSRAQSQRHQLNQMRGIAPHQLTSGSRTAARSTSIAPSASLKARPSASSVSRCRSSRTPASYRSKSTPAGRQIDT